MAPSQPRGGSVSDNTRIPVMNMADAVTATIVMSQQTVQSLKASGYTLDAFQVVETNDDGTMPTVWLSTAQYALNTTLTWSARVKAYTSATAIAVERTIVVGFSADVAPGQMLTIDNTAGTGSVTTDGIPGAVCVLNTTGQGFTVGVTASGTVQGMPQSAPLCAATLHGSDLKLIELTTRVLFVVSGSTAIPGTVVARSLGPGVMVDFAGANERPLTFDVDKGWSWGGATWASSVPPGADLKSILTIRSERLLRRARANYSRLITRH
jgi:hypothetical protein